MSYIFKAQKATNLYMIKVYDGSGGNVDGYRDVHFSIFHDFDPGKNMKVKPSSGNTAGISHFTFITTGGTTTRLYVSGQNIDDLKLTDSNGYVYSKGASSNPAEVALAREMMQELKFVMSSIIEFRKEYDSLDAGNQRTINMQKFAW